MSQCGKFAKVNPNGVFPCGLGQEAILAHTPCMVMGFAIVTIQLAPVG